ncbi:RNA-binding KH domain-containing protein RCF3-like [Alnus glutinosa]|uniref:RNA-binding KH domain-containing protein RCF3-like n=1 Tax=Alnus glutinosa TaxID=3517 RepID=UPI002D7759D7|nr:RNA-binding KH domain-containing protein RCF3-like [Alnus glutinosa]XP_062158309.1 RNA-binding KH domain-containing protein RCF3-like [Alnus glutinosa]XP_062158310.1 RNA-binding KH domain-containing protein RCF3-like [Alnus glutinosa]XP_062158311.1 RNA-binding KH domain-containing protein RCF3-like [Alnus glutinosa]XP_062158312.1 RNA-binding KH domain-containing protein RCF3-like [Alnus glutinosa]XP_062158313.1 RNA-binding KH domain-containing protein RCF3-like [Alnus glutinosa]
MSVALTPSKRPHDRNLTEPNGKGKWQKTQNQPVKSSPGSVVFRLLCPAFKTGGVIGKGGSIISEIRQQTGAKVKVEETVPGCDERVVVVAGSDKEAEVTADLSQKDGGEEAKMDEKHDSEIEQSENNEDKESGPVADPKLDKGISSVQKALLLVFERIIEGDMETGGGEEDSNKPSIILRLLVLSSQVGCLLGKGGSVIKQTSAESGAQIRILPRDKLPQCASVADELVQITGEVDAVRKALQSVSQQLLENPPRDHDPSSTNSSGPPSHSFGHFHPRPDVYPLPNRSFTAPGAPYSSGPRDVADYNSAVPLIAKYHETGIPGRMKPTQEVLTFRLLCHDERVGGVIGKGGTIIKTLKQETGCEIKVMEGVPDSQDRIIVISGAAHPDDRISAVQDAVLRVQTRIVRAVPDNKEQSILARLLVSSNQIGCLLGKGGSIIAEMRKLSRAHIRILGKDQIPKCAVEDEEVVQINGEFDAVQEALLQITTRLRHHFFRDAFPSINYSSNPAFLDQVSPFPSYMGRRELSPPGMYSNLGPSFHKFDAAGGPPPHGGFLPHDDRSPFMHNIHRLGAPPFLSERKPWGPQGLIEGGGPIGLPDFAGGPQRRFGGSQSTIITSTTLEVVVPSSIVPIIYGEDGECLKQIRQISDAKVAITEPKPGAVETVIIISGTPEQSHAAQSLIQAFVLSEAESS